MKFRLEERCKNLMVGITLQIQKEKEYKIYEGHHKILEVELQLKEVHVKYNSLKEISIKDKAQRIQDSIVLERNTHDIFFHNGESPSNMKWYQHPHLLRKF